MPLHYIDFGESVVPITGTDNAFFLDTNILVAYVYEKHDKHIPCYMLLSYLVKNEVILCTSEVVIVELINSLSRVLFIDEKITEFRINNPTDNTSDKNLEKKFKGAWGNVIKQSPEVLKKYSAASISKVKDLINQMLLIDCQECTFEDMIDIMTNSPLASADAMIISNALVFGCQHVFSIDKDMANNTRIDVFTTAATNDSYKINDMMKNLDLKEYLHELLGEDKFKEKFPRFI